jgi:tRNA pseudouridine32 synthase/23S rRNA pseudouridine746 synthase
MQNKKTMLDYCPPPHHKLDIIYADESLLVVSKPAGLLSVPGRAPEHRDCLITRVQEEFTAAQIVHRLDMSTSGLMVLACTQVAHRHLSRQFELRQVSKTYLAVARGHIKQAEGHIDLPLMCDWPNRPRQIVDHAIGKPASTDYRVQNYDRDSDTTRIELYPITGRTHQLRVHLQQLGHPILGDDLYADPYTRQRSDRLLLHASELSFKHPLHLNVLRFVDPAPF